MDWKSPELLETLKLRSGEFEQRVKDLKESNKALLITAQERLERCRQEIAEKVQMIIKEAVEAHKKTA